jgi:hypothetical protein
MIPEVVQKAVVGLFIDSGKNPTLSACPFQPLPLSLGFHRLASSLVRTLERRL